MYTTVYHSLYLRLYNWFMSRQCTHCDIQLIKKSQQSFCSNKCQAEYRYSQFKKEWLEEGKKVVTKNISRHIKRYLIETTGERCSECRWNKRHSVTAKVPLEVDHIDSDSDNNTLKNLRLLCPNCHSLTTRFRNLIRGGGRAWRKKTNTK